MSVLLHSCYQCANLSDPSNFVHSFRSDSFWELFSSANRHHSYFELISFLGILIQDIFDMEIGIKSWAVCNNSTIYQCIRYSFNFFGIKINRGRGWCLRCISYKNIHFLSRICFSCSILSKDNRLMVLKVISHYHNFISKYLAYLCITKFIFCDTFQTLSVIERMLNLVGQGHQYPAT